MAKSIYLTDDQCARVDTRHTPESAYQWILGLIEQLQKRGIDYKEITYTDCANAIAAVSSLTTRGADRAIAPEKPRELDKRGYYKDVLSR